MKRLFLGRLDGSWKLTAEQQEIYRYSLARELVGLVIDLVNSKIILVSELESFQCDAVSARERERI